MAEARTLSNGQFRPANMSIPYILSDQDTPHIRSNSTAAISQANIGVLTRTMVRSPVVKWILPARIRHKDKNDVVLVGERSIEIKDFSHGRHLQGIAVKTDFDSDIRAARIFGATREPTTTDRDSPETEYDAGSSMELDHERPEVPPQMLVLSLQAGRRDSLAFMFAYHDHGEMVRFISYSKPLPTGLPFNGGTALATRLGTHIAVDPESRAMAVAAEIDQVMLINLKRWKRIRREVEQPAGLDPDRYRPIKQERLISVTGKILKMEFLHSPDDGAHRDTVFLAILFRPLGRPSRTYLMWTEWDCTRDLHDIDIEWQRSPLPNNDLLPSLMIPLVTGSGLILACKDRMYHYRDLLSGYASPKDIAYEHHKEKETIEQVENSRAPPIYTSWARPIRHDGYAARDSFYLCREDGVVSFCEVGSPYGGSHEAELIEHIAGKVPVSLETAFACLDNGTSSETTDADHGSFDVLAIAGNTSDGGLFEFATRKSHLPRLQRISNWAPTLDFAVISKSGSGPDTDDAGKVAPCNITMKDRLFTCASRGRRYGSIIEMRYGLEAQCSFSFDTETLAKIDTTLVSKTWLLPEYAAVDTPWPHLANKADDAVLIVSYPEASDRATISWDGQVVENAAASYTEKLLDRSCAVIAVSTTNGHLAIHINQRALRAIGVPRAGSISSELIEHSFGPMVATHASIDGMSSTCLLAFRTKYGYGLSLLRVGTEGEKIQVRDDPTGMVPLRSEVSCTFLTTFRSRLLGLVGLVDGTVLAYDFSGSRPVQLCEHKFVGEFAICESICVLARSQSNRSNSFPIVLCGIRNGTVHILQMLDQDPGPPLLQFSERLDIGLTGANLLADSTSLRDYDNIPTRALVVSGECFCRLFYTSTDADIITIQCIWITHPDLRGLQPSLLRSVAHYAPWDRDRSAFDRALLCMDNDGDRNYSRLIRLADNTQSAAVPRKIQLNGSPSRVIYSHHIEKLIVAFEYVCIPDFRPGIEDGRQPSRRVPFSMIKVVDPDDNDIYVKSEMSEDEDPMVELPVGCAVVGLSKSKILGIVEWTPSLNGKTWSLLAVSTLQPQAGGAPDIGYIYIYHLDVQGGEVRISLKKSMKHESPVTAIATMASNALVYGVGTELVIQQLVLQEGNMKFVPLAKKSILGSARHISIDTNDIYVSMARGSVACLTLREKELVEKLNDDGDRAGIHHVYLPERKLLVASDFSHTVRGLACPAQGRMDASFKPEFEARLPCKISRLRIGSLNPRRGNNGERDRQEIIGSGYDGQFYSFELLGPDEWRLLCFIQNVARKSPDICPFTYEDHLEESVEPVNRPADMHVDGDVLARIVQHGNLEGVRRLRGLIEGMDCTYSGYASVEEATQRLEQLVSSASTVEKGKDPCHSAISFMRGMLQIDT